MMASAYHAIDFSFKASSKKPMSACKKLIWCLDGGTEASTVPSFQMAPLLTDFSTVRLVPRLPCHMIDCDPYEDFTGREDSLVLLQQKLLPIEDGMTGSPKASKNDPQLRACTITGIGGIGKTQVALQFVHKHKGRFNAVFWIHAENPLKIAADFSRCVVSLGLVPPTSLDAMDQILTRDLLLEWLAHPVKRYQRPGDTGPEEASWLLVFDNVDDPDVLEEYWPTDCRGSVLITSRNPMVGKRYSSPLDAMHLNGLNISDATNLLLKLTRVNRNESQNVQCANSIATKLDGQPLALSQMSSMILRMDLKLSEFLKMYEAEGARLFQVDIGSRKTFAGYTHDLVSIWTVEEPGRSSVLWNVLSLFDADGIPEYILQGNPNGKAFEGYPSTSSEYCVARTKLLMASLITRDQVTNQITLHRLLQDAARAQMSQEQYNATFSLSLSLISGVWPYEGFSFGTDVRHWKSREELYPHVRKLQAHSRFFREPTKLSSEHLDGPQLVLDAAW